MVNLVLLLLLLSLLWLLQPGSVFLSFGDTSHGSCNFCRHTLPPLLPFTPAPEFV